MWCKLDTAEEQFVHTDMFNKNKIEIYGTVEKYLKTEGVFVSGSLNEKFNEGE
ncbi:hypothetical protein ACQKK2_26680 [Bacillus paranthracis]|uniref:hypothetical protein n=1 Tax=Bacillus paranthracis TaxID=2026186 RepID=UPI003CFE2E2E